MRDGDKLKGLLPLIAVGWYFYGMLINSIIMGTQKTFPKPGAAPITSIWTANPIQNFLSVFTPAGIGVTFFCALMFCLITKKGYNWLTGNRVKRDPRGFDILPDATHGTSGWMEKKAMAQLLDIGDPAELRGTILGKMNAKDGEDRCFDFS